MNDLNTCFCSQLSSCCDSREDRVTFIIHCHHDTFYGGPPRPTVLLSVGTTGCQEPQRALAGSWASHNDPNLSFSSWKHQRSPSLLDHNSPRRCPVKGICIHKRMNTFADEFFRQSFSVCTWETANGPLPEKLRVMALPTACSHHALYFVHTHNPRCTYVRGHVHTHTHTHTHTHQGSSSLHYSPLSASILG